jgi:hypothetical protein
VAVVVGVNWGIEGVAVCYVVVQMIAVEIPMFMIVLAQMRLAVRTIAVRLAGIAAASALMAVACLIGRWALGKAGIEGAERAAATIVLGIAVYVPALWWLSPSISRRVLEIGKGRITKLAGARRRATVLRPEHG